MAQSEFNWTGVFIRLFFAIALVFCTYNPEGYSFYHWGILEIKTNTPIKLFAAVVLLIGWSIYIRATLHSLGVFGLSLSAAFFGTLIWVVIDQGWIPTDNFKIITYILLVITSLILTTGISWSFVRRRVSGQVDVVDGQDNND